MSDLSQLEVLLGMLRRHGVRHYQDSEVEVELAPEAASVPLDLTGPVGNLADADMDEDYLGEEVYAASQVVPLNLRELRRKREERRG